VQHRFTTARFYNYVFNFTMDLCDFLNGTDSNIVGNWLIKTMSRTLPAGLLHPCPYSGPFRAFNVSPDVSPEMTAFLAGYYRMESKIFNNLDKNIVTFHMDSELL
jgi:Protein of unknown function (DUF1091)